MREWACCDEAASHRLPTAAVFWIIRIVSVEECSSLMQNLTQIHCSHSIIVNAMATPYNCSLNSIYCPPLPSTMTSSLFTRAHSSPVSLAARLHRCHVNHSRYINNGWTFSRQTLYFRNWLFMAASSQSLLIKKLLTFPLRFFKYSPYPSLPVPSPRPPVFMVRFYIFSHSLLVWKYLFFLGTQCLGISTALSPPREPTSLFHNGKTMRISFQHR